MTADRLYSPLGPVAVAAFVISWIVVRQPLSGDFVGVPMNAVAIFILAVGGLVAAAGS